MHTLQLCIQINAHPQSDGDPSDLSEDDDRGDSDLDQSGSGSDVVMDTDHKGLT